MSPESKTTGTIAPLSRLAGEIRRQCRVSITDVVEPPPNGFTNTVYFANSSAGRVVVRVAASGEIDTYRKEADVAARARSLGVRTPAVLGVGTTEREAFHVSQYVPGYDLNSSLVPAPGSAWQEVGEMTQRLHSCRIPHDTPEWRPDASIARFAEDRLRYCATVSRSGAPHVGPARLERITEALAVLHTRTISSVLCHGNLQGNNVRVDESERPWLIDWGSASGHTRLMDIAELYFRSPGEENRKAFYEGYGERFSDEDPFVRELVILKLATGKVWLNEKLGANPSDPKRYIAEDFRVTKLLDRYLGLP